MTSGIATRRSAPGRNYVALQNTQIARAKGIFGQSPRKPRLSAIFAEIGCFRDCKKDG